MNDETLNYLNNLKQTMGNQEDHAISFSHEDDDNKNLLITLNRFVKNTLDNQIDIIINNKLENFFNNEEFTIMINQLLNQYMDNNLFQENLKQTIKKCLQECFKL